MSVTLLTYADRLGMEHFRKAVLGGFQCGWHQGRIHFLFKEHQSLILLAQRFSREHKMYIKKEYDNGFIFGF